MKFSCQVDINLPQSKVLELWQNPENMKQWQDGLQSFEHMSGTKGENGAKSKMVYKAGKRNFELIETVIDNQLPDSFTGEYAAKTMTNTMHSIFTPLSENSTRWTAEIDYNKFNGFLPNLMRIFFKGMFKKQTQKWLNQFKDFAENNG